MRGSVFLLSLVFLCAGFAGYGSAQIFGQAVEEESERLKEGARLEGARLEGTQRETAKRFDLPFGQAEEMPEEVEEETGRQMIDYPIVKLRSLDKITARTVTFEAQVGSTLKFGPIFIKVQACRKASALDEPEAAAFLQVWEVTPEQQAQWIFSGWMFASSPGLSAMDHAIYDVWVLDCLSDLPGDVSGDIPEEEDSAPEEDEGVVKDDAVPAKPEDDL